MASKGCFWEEDQIFLVDKILKSIIIYLEHLTLWCASLTGTESLASFIPLTEWLF